MKYFLFLACFSISIWAGAQKNASVSFEKWVSLKNVSNPLISPDGRTVVFTVTSTDWANNAYDSELWMSRDGETPIQLTRTQKNSSFGYRFTPDSRFVSFLADRGEKNQIFLISVQGGEAMQLTRDEDGVGGYEWNHDGSRIAYTKTDAESKKDKTVKERYGSFGVEGEEYRLTHLWVLNFHMDSVLLAGQLPCYGIKKDSTKPDSLPKKGQDCFTLPTARRLTEGSFTVSGFAWSPDGKSIIFNRQVNPLINSSLSSDIVLIDLATKKNDSPGSKSCSRFFPALAAGWRHIRLQQFR